MGPTIIIDTAQTQFELNFTLLSSEPYENVEYAGITESFASIDIRGSSFYYNLTQKVLNSSGIATVSTPVVGSSSEGVFESQLIIPLYVIIFLLSVIGNSLVFITLMQNKRMRTVTNVYLLNLVSNANVFLYVHLVKI